MKVVEESRQRNQMLISTASIESNRFLELQEEQQLLKEKIENYDKMVPSDRDLGGFLQKITALMDEHELKEQNVQPSEEIHLENLTCIPVRMKCKGSLEQLFEFFKSLENLERAIRIEQVELANDQDLSGEITMNAFASVYYEGQKSQEG
jgi:Tfp pilus assembly protein PilO